MDVKNLVTLKTVLSEGSFQKAAYKLGYTQSTITFQIQQLEQEFSLKLFEKIGRRMALSQAGKEILPYVDEILAGMEKIQNHGKGGTELKGMLNVATGETLLCYKMQEVLKEFRRRAPDVLLSLRSMNCYEIRDGLLSGGVDIGIFYDVKGYSDSLTVYPLGDFPLSMVASPHLEPEKRDFLSGNQRIHTSLIINEPDCVFRQIFEQYLKGKDIVLDNTIELWSIATIKNSVDGNLGISYLPTFTVEGELKTGSLEEIPTGLDGTLITAICAHHKNKWISPAMKLFIDIAKAYI